MENLNKQIQELKRSLIPTAISYFSVVPVSPPRVESRISEAWTDCITNSTITRRRRF